MERSGAMFDSANAARILVVDDEPGITKVLKRVLEENNFTVECANDGKQGLQMFEEGNFDIVISDYKMPGMNGVEMLAEMVSISPTTPGILLTAYAELETAISAINEGKVYAFLTKPWDDNALLLSIRQALESRRLYAENVELRNALLLQKLSTATGAAADVKQVMEISLNHLSDEFDFDFGSAYLTGQTDKGKLTKAAEVCTHSGFLTLSEINGNLNNFLGAALSEGVPQIRKVDTDAEVAIPLLFGRNAVGVLFFLQPDVSMAQAKMHLELFKAIGSYIGMALGSARLRERSIEQEKMAAVGSAIACLSHDIKNILTPIISGVDLLQEGILKDGKNVMLSRWCDMIANGTGHLLDLVGELLDFAKPKKPSIDMFDLAQLLEKISSEARVSAEGKSVEVVLKLHAQTMEAWLDSARLYRSLSNIMRNGIEAMEDGGMLSIETREVEAPPSMVFPGDSEMDAPPRAIQISISDTGEGIQPEALDKIFTPFFTTKGATGTGLGLVIAKQIIEEHGGLIHVDSKPSKGTTFTMFLPLTQHTTDICALRDASAPKPERPTDSGREKTASLPFTHTTGKIRSMCT